MIRRLFSNHSWLRYGAILSAGMIVFCCNQNQSGLEKVTSTSVTTGNPTGLLIDFKSDTADEAVTGKAEIFGSKQIPIPGYGSRPLATLSFSNAHSVLIDSSNLDSITDSVLKASYLEISPVLEFNVVITSDKGGTIVEGLQYRRSEKSFEDTSISEKNPINGLLETDGTLKPLMEVRCLIDTEKMDPGKIPFLFKEGTGFYARGNAGIFIFPGLPEGRYEMRFISLPHGDGGSSFRDSLLVYKLVNLVDSRILNAVEIKGVSESIPISDSLKSVRRI